MQFRLPLGKHQKKSVWSKFIDPITREEIILDKVYIMDISKTDLKFEPEEEIVLPPVKPVLVHTNHGDLDISIIDAFHLLSNESGFYRGAWCGDVWRGDCPFCGRRKKLDPSFTLWKNGAKCYAADCQVFAHDALALISKSLKISRYEARLWIEARIKNR